MFILLNFRHSYCVGYYFAGGGIRSDLNKRIFRIQKRVMRSMVGVSSRTSCRQLFKESNNLTLASLYMRVSQMKTLNIYI